MNTDSTLEFTNDEFDRAVLESDRPVLVDFYGENCPPCRQLAPVIDQLASEYAGRVKVGKLNAHENPSALVRFQIGSVPTLVLFDGGEVQRRVVGLQSKDAIQDLLDAYLQVGNRVV